MSERVSNHRSEGASPARDNTPWLERYTEFLVVGQRAIELGCGLGHDAAQLAAAGLHVTALDHNPTALSQAHIVAPRASFILGDIAQGLPFRTGAADLVVASLSLHYFERRTTVQILDETARILKPGSAFILRVNAVGDVNFGYGQGVEIEPDLFRIPQGWLKRFFTAESLSAFLEPHFDVHLLQPRAIVQRGEAKRTLECLAIRR